MRKLLLACAVLVAALTASTAVGATVRRDTVAEQFTEQVTSDCGPALSGTLNGSGVTTTQSVETDRGFHITGTISGSGRIDWSDGSFTLIESVDRFSFQAVVQGTTVFTETHTDSGDLHSADGTFRARQTFHEVEHLTVTDGVVHVDFSKGHFHVYGIC